MVDFSLDLHALGWNAFQMGLVYTAALLAGASLALCASPLSDRAGRKPFLIGYSLAQALAALCYVLRAACNRGTAGARQAVGVALVGPARRGLAASLNSASMQIPRSLGPIIGGVLLDADLLALPLLLAAILQGSPSRALRDQLPQRRLTRLSHLIRLIAHTALKSCASVLFASTLIGPLPAWRRRAAHHHRLCPVSISHV